MQTLEVEVETRAELLRALEAAKVTQRTDLENHVATVQTAADQAQAELGTAKQQLDQVMLIIHHSTFKKTLLSQIEKFKSGFNF